MNFSPSPTTKSQTTGPSVRTSLFQPMCPFSVTTTESWRPGTLNRHLIFTLQRPRIKMAPCGTGLLGVTECRGNEEGQETEDGGWRHGEREGVSLHRRGRSSVRHTVLGLVPVSR